MEKLPTAKDFFAKKYDESSSEIYWVDFSEQALIEFAKMHVEAALKEASEKISSLSSYEENVRDVLNSYPLSNIK